MIDDVTTVARAFILLSIHFLHISKMILVLNDNTCFTTSYQSFPCFTPGIGCVPSHMSGKTVMQASTLHVALERTVSYIALERVLLTEMCNV
jgi:hypothetical protein